MPGFMINSVGGEASGDDVLAYYTYTWEIMKILTADGAAPPLVYLKDMSLPTFSINQERVKGASLNYKYAGDVTWEDVKITWYDTKGMLNFVVSWRQTVWTPDGGLASPSDYKTKSVIATSLPDGASVNKFELINSWPSSIRYGDLTYTQSDVKIVDVTITYDWAVEIPADSA